MNLLTPGVMTGLIGASSLVRSTEASMGLYSREAAKRKPDMELMGRAVGYVGNALASARKESEKAAKELEEARAKAEEQAEEEAKLQENPAEQPPEAADTVEISEEGQASLRRNASSEADSSSDGVKDETANEPLVYSSTGAVRPAFADANPVISLSV